MQRYKKLFTSFIDISIFSLFTLNFVDFYHSGNATPTNKFYNGNIGAIAWRAGSENANRTYQFTYNGLDWLTAATYSGTGSYSTSYSYDKMGNLQTLTRYGKYNSSTYQLIDNLSYTYTGNQIAKIEDASTYTPTYTGAFNFVNGASQSGEYTYDQNGNLTKDLNKNISSIGYNLLNLPTNISYSSGKSAAYVYDATGRKLRTSYKASASATAVPTDYCGNMIYENNVLKQILIDGGYITLSGTAPYYHYYLKDHLGNNRVVVSPAGTAEQINHYYPFGGLFGESTGNTVQRFRFNGKEFDRTHGIDWYDYGARHMTPDAGRFTTIDPMAEKYYNTSPYVYCANNPVNYIDLRGDSLTLTGEQEDIDKTLDIYNKGLGGYYSVKADNNGLVSISPITGKDPSEMRREQQTFYSVISSAVEGEGMAKINIVNNSDEVIIANALNKAIDIGDINAIGDGPYINKYSVIAHETYEAYNFQARNIPLIKAHLNASGIENLMTGSYIDPLQRNIKANGLSSIPIRSKNGNKIIHTINIYTVNGNVKKVSR